MHREGHIQRPRGKRDGYVCEPQVVNYDRNVGTNRLGSKAVPDAGGLHEQCLKSWTS